MALIEAPMYLTFDDLTLLPGPNSGSPDGVSLASRVSRRHVLPLPVISAAMPSVTEDAMAIAMGELGGLGVIHRHAPIARQQAMVAAVARYAPDRTIYPGASVTGGGTTLLCAASCAPGDVERGAALVDAGARILFLDTPNPTNEQVLAGAARLRQALDVDLVIGSVVDGETARRYVEIGIDAIKVGLGSGALCSIRRTAGVGAPQVTALAEVCAVAGQHGVPVIADGGITCSGDIVKALAIGASAVMLGSLLASCDETPGTVVEIEGRRWKEVSGLRLDDLELPKSTGLPRIDAYVARHGAPRVEGGETRVPASGPCHLALLMLVRGVRMGVHLSGGTDLASLRARARFARVSPAGAAEAHIASVRRG